MDILQEESSESNTLRSLQYAHIVSALNFFFSIRDSDSVRSAETEEQSHAATKGSESVASLSDASDTDLQIGNTSKSGHSLTKQAIFPISLFCTKMA